MWLFTMTKKAADCDGILSEHTVHGNEDLHVHLCSLLSALSQHCVVPLHL